MSVTRINEFTAQPGKHTDLIHALKSIIATVKALDGCEAVDIYSNNDTRKVLVIEQWRDITAHQAAAKNINKKDFEAVMILLVKPATGKYFKPAEG